MKIAQILTLKHPRFLRTIINSINILRVFVPVEYQELINNYKQDIVFFNSTADLVKKVNEYHPDFVLLTVEPIDIPTFECCNIFYVPHGIFHKTDINSFQRWSKDIGYMPCDVYGYNLLKNIMSNVIKINGLPQFDELLNYDVNKKRSYLKKKFDPKGPIILIINGSNDEYYATTDHITDIVETTRKVYLDSFILLKNKLFRNDHDEKIYKNLHYDNFEVVHDFIYPYLASDIVIVVEGGTAFFESLLVNPKTIQFGEGTFGVKEKGLLVSKNCENLENILRDVEFLASNQNYIQNKAQYLRKIIGGQLMEFSSQIAEVLQHEKLVKNFEINKNKNSALDHYVLTTILI